MESGDVGTWLGLIIGVGGIIGAPLGGWLADRMGQGNRRWYAWVPAISAVAGVPFAAGFLLFDSLTAALWIYGPAVVLNAMYLGPVLASIQAMVKLRMRAMASAVLFLILNLIGLGLGPQVVGMLNDVLSGRFGDDAVRYSLLVVGFTSIWVAYHFAAAGRTLEVDLRAKGRNADRP